MPTPNIHQFIVRTKNRMDRATIERQIKKDLRSSAMFSGTGRRNLTMAMKQIRSANLDPSTSDIVVDLGQGRSKVHMMHNLCPTITRTRAARDDFFLVSNASRITALDCMHLQGLNSFKVDLNGLKCSEIGQLAGNAMTIPVLAAILRASLVLTGMAKNIDVEPVVDRHAPRVSGQVSSPSGSRPMGCEHIGLVGTIWPCSSRLAPFGLAALGARYLALRWSARTVLAVRQPARIGNRLGDVGCAG